MELQTAIEILEYHQEWRLGIREDMIHEPIKLTQALDIVLSEIKKFSLGAVIGSACLRHKPKQLGYLQWFDWAEKKKKRGAKQKQCPKCGRWYFREEF